MSDTHIDSDSIAAFAEGRLLPDQRLRVEAHLERCQACRQDALAVVQLRRATRRRRWLTALPIAAATIAAVYFAPPRDAAVPRTDIRFRPDDATEGSAPLRAWSPGPAAVASDSVRFAWAPDGADALFRLTVTDETGAVLWQLATGDTAAALPDSVSLGPGRRYHWYVDVTLATGGRATTGLLDFRTLP